MNEIFQISNMKYKDILDIKELNIHKNKITCVIGESGSGKTTLLKTLNNMITPDGGSILFQGENIHGIDPIHLRRRVIMLGQNPVIFPGKIRDNLNIGLKFSEKEPLGDELLKKYLKMVHLEKDLDQGAEKLSGGEKQRLALARVLLLEPEVLLLDEPSSSLDEDTEGVLINTIAAYVRNSKKTLIMVTHSKGIAQEYGQHIVKLNNGKVEREGEI